MAYAWSHIFGDLGKVVKGAWLLLDCVDDIDDLKLELDSQFDDDADDIDYLGLLITAFNSAQSTVRGSVRTIGSRIRTYLTTLLKEKIDSTYAAWADIFDDLDAKMVAESETIKGCSVGAVPAFVETGDDNNQLSRYDLMRGIKSVNLDASLKLYVSIVDDGHGYLHVDFFKDAARSTKVGHTAPYDSTGLKAVVPNNDSELCGQLNVDAVTAADADIVVTFSFSGARIGTGQLTDWGATQMAIDDDLRIECISAASPGTEQWRVYSRVRGVAAQRATTGTPFTDPNREVGFTFTVATGHVDFAVGDQFLLGLGSDDDGRFQVVFRDYLTDTLPYEVDGTETISDSLTV